MTITASEATPPSGLLAARGWAVGHCGPRARGFSCRTSWEVVGQEGELILALHLCPSSGRVTQQ